MLLQYILRATAGHGRPAWHRRPRSLGAATLPLLLELVPAAHVRTRAARTFLARMQRRNQRVGGGGGAERGSLVLGGRLEQLVVVGSYV